MRPVIVAVALLCGSQICASAAEHAVPDFTGPWGRNMFNFEPPDSGPGPIVNLRRLGADVNAFGSSTGTIPGFELA